MRYIEAERFGGPEVLKAVEGPTPTPGKESLLVEVEAAGVNYLDLVARAGHYPGLQAPFRPGMEIVGIVRGVGEGVEVHREGDRVGVLSPNGGGYASHAIVPAQAAIPLPPSIDPAVAAAVLLQGTTAYLLVEDSGATEGATVLVSGAAGGVVSIAVRLAKLKGAQVIGLASGPKHAKARERGADHVFDYGASGWSASVLAATEARGVDAYLDSQGDLGSEAFSALRDLARWIVYGTQSGTRGALLGERVWPMIGKSLALRGFNLETRIEDVPRALGDLLRWAEDGTLEIEVAKYPLAEAATVHGLVEARRTTGKVVLIP